jgi:hypothetical protein
MISRFLGTALAAVGLSGPAPAQPQSENMEYMGNIARAIIDSDELENVDWLSFSIVFEIDADGKVDGTYGYAYDQAGKATPIAPRPREVREPVAAYREWLRQEGDKGIIKMLFQFNRKTRKVNADFEYENADRWKVTPKNVDAMINELRPDPDK